MNNVYVAFLHGKIVAICEAILTGKIGVIAGSRAIVSLHFQLLEKNDPDFSTFRVIDSETDHLPVDCERKNWSAETLERKDAEIAKNESFYESEIFPACEKLIRRFEHKNS